ncbi:MAG: phosphopentomutase, partial [Melioribacteraceae bacterium]
MNNFVVIVLDGVGIGELPDAEKYSDVGSNTLGNLARRMNGLNLRNLQKLGLGNISDI